MAHESLAARTAKYIDHSVHHVDITKCTVGAHARAIKPGGVDSIVTSIKEDGYKPVRISRHLITIVNHSDRHAYAYSHCLCAAL